MFPSLNGTPQQYSNLFRRVLAPVAQEIEAPWAGFHTFRHTAASMLFARGANAVQVQRWLGHHSPAFTLSVYVHLLDEDLGEPLDPSAELRVSTQVATQATGIDRNGTMAFDANTAA